MINFGFARVAAAVPKVRVADCQYNAEQIWSLIERAANENVHIVVFPELSITGYTCGDLFHNSTLLDAAEEWLNWLARKTVGLKMVAIVGTPLRIGNKLYNCAAVLDSGAARFIIPKTYLPNYGEFYEKRWFESGEKLFHLDKINIGNSGVQAAIFKKPINFNAGFSFGIEICEDLWTPIPPSCELAKQGADIIFNLSATNEIVGKHAYLTSLIRQQSARCVCGYVYASAGFGESSTDLVYAGNAIVAENGEILEQNRRFEMVEQLIINDIDVELLRNERLKKGYFGGEKNESDTPPNASQYRLTTLQRNVNPLPFVPSDEKMAETCDEILQIQTHALATRLTATGIKKMVVGISGGLDSTLALLVCVLTCNRLKLPHSNIVAVTMPGFGTSDRTYQNAIKLIEKFGATCREISIAKAVEQHFSDIGHDKKLHDATYENSQARERTQILMDIANQCNGLVIGTGDLSELALGWATYNGDHMSMYAVNASIPKTLIKTLVKYAATCDFAKKVAKNLLDVVETPVSPELLPADETGEIAQKTEDLVGPYELHDFFLFHTLRNGFSPEKIQFLAHYAFAKKYDKKTIKHWLTKFYKRFFSQQFKRSCMPDGPKVGCVSLSPRGDWRMPSDAKDCHWINSIK